MAILLIIVGGFVLLLAGALQQRIKWLQAVCSRVIVSYVTLMLLFGAGELYLRFFYKSIDTRLARIRWMDNHWQTNSLGFRDHEWTQDDYENKETVIVSGDSFTAGWGINDPADRYTDVLQSLLGDDYAVINIGENGSSTLDSLRRIQDYPYQQPDTIIMQYFLNDIESAANSLGLAPDFPTDEPWWAQDSHLMNFLYGRYVQPRRLGAVYWNWQYAAYDNFRIWEAHEAELRDFADYADSVGARMIVLVYPNMHDPFRSIPYVDRVAQVFEGFEHVETLKLFDDVAAWDIETDGDLVVSAYDAHPSVAFNRHVAEKVYQLYFAGES